MHNKRILLIADFDKYGGTMTYFFQLYELLREDAILTIYIDSDFDISDLIIKDNNVTIIKSPFKKYQSSLINISLTKINLIYLLIKGYDNIIVSTGNYFKYLIFSIFLRKKFIYILHSYPISKPKLNFLKYFFYNKLYNLIKKSNSKFITVSQYSRDQISNYFIYYNVHFLFQVIYNTSFFSVSDYDEVNFEKKMYILTIGHLEKWKNPDLWVKIATLVCSINHKVSFVWIGDGSLKETVKNKIPTIYLDRIKLIGSKSKSEIAKYYSECYLYLQPSLEESFGLSLLDAMMYKKCCIASNNAAFPEILNNNITGFLVDINNHINFADVILNLLEDKNKVKEISNRAYMHASNYFSYKKWSKNIINILN